MKKVILTLTIVMFAFIATHAQSTTTTAPQDKDNPNAPVITFENIVHDYGTVQKGGDGNTEFKFTNTGKEPLVLTNVTTS
jgi:hypothetical protein